MGRLSAAKKFQMLDFCTRRLNERGIRYEQIQDSEQAARRIRAMKRPEPMPLLSVDHRDFEETNSFWLFLVDDQNNDIGSVGARIDNLGNRSLADHWRRLARRILGDNVEGFPSIPATISGKAIYIGDMFLDRELRGEDGPVRAAIFAMYILSSMEWPDFDYIYAVVNEVFVGQGSAAKYCATFQVQAPALWDRNNPKFPNWLLMIDPAGIEYYCDLFLGNPEMF